MKSRFAFIIKYFVFWILIFVLQKLIFMIFNYQESKLLKFIDWIGVVKHGLRLDMSAAAYLMVLPVFFISIFSFAQIKYTRAFLKYYNYIFLFIVLFIGVVDMELYSWWGVKLDITPLVYLKTPKEAAASLKIIEILLLLLFFIIIYIAGLSLFRKYIFTSLSITESSNEWKFSIPGVFLTALLFIPMRGGVGIAPVNLGSAYFHSNRFANHSAVNVLWNCLYSIIERKGMTSSHKYMPDEKATELFNNFYPNDTTHIQLVRKNSNIILIILESFSDKIIHCLGGEPGITPEIDSICSKSIVFVNFFASGDRSEKGMLSLFSGYPSQPTTTIINYPNKTQNLPFLTEPFHEKGYNTAFYYGGDLNFANFRSYFTNSSMDKLITLDDFPPNQKSEKWGISDEFLFDRMLNDLDTFSIPFFISGFTLSSHEPYDVPMAPVFKDNNRNDQSKNAFYYTDKCLGEFIREARKKSWWQNTLIIMVADHGSRYPGNTQNHVPQKFRIPMIWTGGAILKTDTLICNYGSQTDLARTLLKQYDLPASGYRFSRDILGEDSRSFAMYFFNNGFGYMSDNVKLIYDNNINDYIFAEGTVNDSVREASKAYLQVLSQDFNSR